MTEPKKSYDLYRDSLLRYFGYCNEVGEAFRGIWAREVVNMTYVVSVSYVLADTFDKGRKEYEKPGSTPQTVAIKAGDVLLWQMFASVIIPGFTIHKIASATRFIVTKGKIPCTKYLPTVIGLLSIPLIIHPIDTAVDTVMDESYRKYLK